MFPLSTVYQFVSIVHTVVCTMYSTLIFNDIIITFFSLLIMMILADAEDSTVML